MGRLIGIVAGLGILLGPAAFAQRVDSSVGIGRSERLWSHTLEQERRVLVYVPPTYHLSRQRYPVLYLLDGETHFNYVSGMVQFLASYNARIPEMIVVGVTNIDRVHDLTQSTADPKEQSWAPQSGGAPQYLQFIADELVPLVDAEYRTQPYRMLVGHSFGAQFALHALLSRPEVFRSYIAISPGIHWNRQGTVREFEARVRSLSGTHELFLSWGDNETAMRVPTEALTAVLKAKAPPSLQWTSRYYPGEDHGTTPLRTIYDGLLWNFSRWELPLWIEEQPQDIEMSAVEAHYAKLSRRFGYTVSPSYYAMERVAATLQKRGATAEAFELIQRNVEEYPYLPDAHERLAEALERKGQLDEARVAYQSALSAAVRGEHPYSPRATYQRHIDQLDRRRDEQKQ